MIAAFSFALGRYTKPGEVQIVERLQVLTVEKTRYAAAERSLKVEERNKDEIRDRIFKERVVVMPDGTKVEEREERDFERATETETKIEYVEKIIEIQVDKIVEVEKEKLVYESRKAPDWQLGLTFEADAPEIISDLTFLPQEHMVLGVDARRRLWGPVFGGLTAKTNGFVGATLSLEF